MTTIEACTLLVDAIQQQSLLGRERDACRRVAVAAIHFAHEQHVELERLRGAYRRLLDERSSGTQWEAA